MRTTRKGKVKLQRGDVQVGSFIFHAEKDHYKLTDINGVFSVRVSGYTTIGVMMRAALDAPKENETFLHNYAAVMYNALSAVPDMEFLAAVNDAAVSAVERHKDMYGVVDEIGEERDAEILQEEKELEEATHEARMEILGHD
ncbi:MAG: hypothetical protein J6U51_07445 [Bacteroidales bacterium]|nr:hypothetical protein [Bacteroidales bacterium]